MSKGFTLEDLKQSVRDDVTYIQDIFDGGWEADCPCSYGRRKIDGYYVTVQTRCWRVSTQKSMGYQDLHVTTKHPKKDEIIKLLIKGLDSQEWYNPYRLVEKEVTT